VGEVEVAAMALDGQAQDLADQAQALAGQAQDPMFPGRAAAPAAEKAAMDRDL
jgi:hypothetical protein